MVNVPYCHNCRNFEFECVCIPGYGARKNEVDDRFKCPSCKSKGFEPSVLGPHCCTFCDGTFSGNPPSPQDIEDEKERIGAATKRALKDE